MWTKLFCLTMCLVSVTGQHLQWKTPWSDDGPEAPEPRSFASLAEHDSTLYMYGGFVHSTSRWLADVWSLNLSELAPAWQRLNMQIGDLLDPLEHATLVTLGDAILLVGGLRGDRGINDRLYRLNTTSRVWQDQNLTMPALFWHSAVTYPVNGSSRVLLTGGLNASGATVNNVYELYEVNNGTYKWTELAPMPKPLFGHALVAGNDSTVYLSGGLSGRLPALPRAAVPPGLVDAVKGTSIDLYLMADVRQFNRQGGQNETIGNWTSRGSVPRKVAFHVSWIPGSALYVYGGVQAASSSIGYPSIDVAYGLQRAPLGGNGYQPPSNDTFVLQAAAKKWGLVQPGSLAGAAVWAANGGRGTSGASMAKLWLFGGWAVPQPLPFSTDTYFAPQDSSLTWRLNSNSSTFIYTTGGGNGGGGTIESDFPGIWMAPLMGGIAPRSGSGVMVAAVTLNGVAKLLVFGGRTRSGWTGNIAGSSKFLDYNRELLFPTSATPLANAKSYQLYDMWLYDIATGARQQIWIHTSATDPTPDPAQCTAMLVNDIRVNDGACVPRLVPYGTAVWPAVLGPAWDRRLLEYGSGGEVLYLQAMEALRRSPDGSRITPYINASIWRLSLSLENFLAADGSFIAPVATWQLLSAPATVDAPAAPCYPRLLYGAAHLTSSTPSAANTSYLALFGGLTLTNLTVGQDVDLQMNPTSRVCLLELVRNGGGGSEGGAGGVVARWLGPPDYAAGSEPTPRYRHACAPRLGQPNYSMTCYGGISNINTNITLGDAWTFVLQPGIKSGASESGSVLPKHLGSWTLAAANYSATRPGGRLDHLMVPLRGPEKQPQDNSAGLLQYSNYSPVLLLGGRTRVESSSNSTTPRGDVWLLEAAACDDPDVKDPLAVWKLPLVPYRTTQVWLPMVPLVASVVGSGLSKAAGVSSGWVAAATVVQQAQGGPEVWLVVADGAEGGAKDVGPLRLLQLTGNSDTGCLSSALRPSCSSLSYSYGAASSAGCWAGTENKQRLVVRQTGAAANLKIPILAQDLVGFVLADADGVGLPYRSFTLNPKSQEYTLNDIRLPYGGSDEYNVTMYGKPYVVIDSTQLDLVSADEATLAVDAVAMSLQVLITNISVPNTTVELRVSYNGLYRKRHCWDTFTDCDQVYTNRSGMASLNIIPINAAKSPVSYVVFVTPPCTTTPYLVPLQSPPDFPSSTVVTESLVNVTLHSGKRTSYTLSLQSASSPLSDGREWLNFTLNFLPPNGSKLYLPKDRQWTAVLSQNSGTLEVANATYPDVVRSDSTASKRLERGDYALTVIDSWAPWLVLVEPTATTFSTPSSNSLSVPLAGLAYTIAFNGTAYNSQELPASPCQVTLSSGPEMYDPARQGLYGRVESKVLWSSDTTDGVGQANFSVIPGHYYTADIYFMNLKLASYQKQIIGTTLFEEKVLLPYTLMCVPNIGGQVQMIQDQPQGRFPKDGRNNPILYFGDQVCNWTISTSQRFITVEITFTDFQRDDLICIGSEPCKSGSFSSPLIFISKTSSVNIAFIAGESGGKGANFSVKWSSSSTLMPAQFIMMIAAASAAAGAVLLILCMWHCVFRPVQQRRQAAADRNAAAANAAANATPAANAAARAGGGRNRVPRRYLRMMEVSVYGVKEAEAAARAAKLAIAGAMEGGTTEGGEGAGGGAQVSASPLWPAPSVASSSAVHPSGDPNTVTQPDESRNDDKGGSKKDLNSVADGDASGDICAICLCEFEEGDRLKHLPCKHYYHVPCIDQWLGRDITCPLCKANVLEAMHTLFGPLPPKNSAASTGPAVGGPGAGQTGGDSMAAAVVAFEGREGRGGGSGGMQESTSTEVTGANVPGGGGGVLRAGVATTASDLEMVVISPAPPGVVGQPSGGAMGAASSGAGAAAGGMSMAPSSSGTFRVRAGGHGGVLPGSMTSSESSATGVGLQSGTTPEVNARVAVTEGTTSNAMRGLGASLNASGATASTVAAAGGGGMAGVGFRSASRELRPSRRPAVQDTSSSTDTEDSDGDVELPQPAAAGAASGRFFTTAGNGGGGGGGGSSVMSANAYCSISRPSLANNQFLTVTSTGVGGVGVGCNTNGAAVWASDAPANRAACGSGDGLASVTLAEGGFSGQVGGGAGSSSDPSPRPVVEAVQTCPTSPRSGRWGVAGPQGTSAHAPRPPVLPAVLTAAAVPSSHHHGHHHHHSNRTRGAHDAQLAVEAAALSAAAAGVSSGGSGSWTGGPAPPSGSMSTGDGGVVLWPHARAAHANKSYSSLQPVVNIGPVSQAAPAAVPPSPSAGVHVTANDPPAAPYRVHTNPLASLFGNNVSNKNNISINSNNRSPCLVGGVGEQSMNASAGIANAVSVPTASGGPLSIHHTVSVLMGSPSSAAVPTAAERSRQNSGSSYGGGSGVSVVGRLAGGLAVPEVSVGSDDVIRTPASMSRLAGSGGGGGSSGGM